MVTYIPECTVCALCCKKYKKIEIEKEDVKKYGEQNCWTVGDKHYLKMDSNGCVFLENGLCTIYEKRPNVCSNYGVRGKKCLILLKKFQRDKTREELIKLYNPKKRNRNGFIKKSKKIPNKKFY